MPIIKRYSNRKFYDTQAKRYITLEGIADLIQQGQEVQVTDHDTGKDITPLVQAQTIFELEKKLKGTLPGALLTQLIRRGSSTINQIREAISPDEAARVDAEIGRRIRDRVSRGDLSEEEGNRLLLLLAGGDKDQTVEELDEAALAARLAERRIPSHDDWKSMLERIDALNADLKRLTKPPRQAARKKPGRARAPRG